MKAVIVILDGAGDYAVPALAGRTPLEHAYLPNLTFLAQRGRSGLVDAVFPDLPCESIVAALGILGYDPHEFFPNGRASFEAAASGIRLGADDLAFRCNLISTRGGAIEDFTAGLIDDTRARNIVLGIPREDPAIELFPSQSYRNILIYRGAKVPASEFECFPPHQHRGGVVEELWVRPRSRRAEPVAAALNAFQQRSIAHIARLNEEYGTQASMLWIWSPSDAPAMPGFRARFGVRGAVVGGLHFIRGIGLSAQMLAADVPGANGYIDSNLAGKTAAAIDLLREVDVVLVHLNAADEEAHQRNVAGKIQALELFDEKVIGPLARHLRESHAGAYRMAILPDHYTCVADGHHVVHPVPCLLWGTGIEADATVMFAEREAAERGSFHMPSWHLVPLLLDDAR